MCRCLKARAACTSAAQLSSPAHMLEVTLGPGMLSKNYDGLQNDLDTMDGVFLPAANIRLLWMKTASGSSRPWSKPGDTVRAADWLGQRQEGWIDHKIMVPFDFRAPAP